MKNTTLIVLTLYDKIDNFGCGISYIIKQHKI